MNCLKLQKISGYIQILILDADVAMKLWLCRSYSTDTTALMLPNGYWKSKELTLSIRHKCL